MLNGPAGTGTMSPRIARCGRPSTAEFAKPIPCKGIPASRAAVAEIGRVPPLMAMVIALDAAPAPASSSPGTDRFRQTNAATSP